MRKKCFIGAMSGTSGDGVDAALVCISSADGEKGHPYGQTFDVLSNRPANDWSRLSVTLQAAASLPFAEDLRALILQTARTGRCDVSDLAKIGREVADAYVAVVEKLLTRANMTASDVTAIAAHGQTLFHAPPLSLQVFDPTVLAVRFGIDVISDFRHADLAVGGQGAPLVPFADFHLFGSADEDRVVANVGGIANITLLPHGQGPGGVGGGDTGPGNCLSDWLMRDRGGFDTGGRLAATGRPIAVVVEGVLAQVVGRAERGASADVAEQIEIFRSVATTKAPDAPLADLLATANTICVEALHRAVERAVLAGRIGDPIIVVAGGGVLNDDLMSRLRQRRPRLVTSDHFGIPSQMREAVAFAVLGWAFCEKVPANLPAVTGAKRSVVLGSLTPGGAAAV